MKLLGTLAKNYNPSEKTNFKVIRSCYKMKKGQHSLVQRPMVIHWDEAEQESHRASKSLPTISVYRESIFLLAAKR